MAHGEVIIVRFADDFVMGFEEYQDACRFLHDLRERFAKFGLELHPGKTRLIEFGRFAAANRHKRGAGKPETFDFLGFTHICAKMRDGRFWVRRITVPEACLPGLFEEVVVEVAVGEGAVSGQVVAADLGEVVAVQLDQVREHGFMFFSYRGEFDVHLHQCDR